MASSLFGSLPPVAAAPKGDTADELNERSNDHGSRKRPRIEELGGKGKSHRPSLKSRTVDSHTA